MNTLGNIISNLIQVTYFDAKIKLIIIKQI